MDDIAGQMSCLVSNLLTDLWKDQTMFNKLFNAIVKTETKIPVVKNSEDVNQGAGNWIIGGELKNKAVKYWYDKAVELGHGSSENIAKLFVWKEVKNSNSMRAFYDDFNAAFIIYLGGASAYSVTYAPDAKKVGRDEPLLPDAGSYWAITGRKGLTQNTAMAGVGDMRKKMSAALVKYTKELEAPKTPANKGAGKSKTKQPLTDAGIKLMNTYAERLQKFDPKKAQGADKHVDIVEMMTLLDQISLLLADANEKAKPKPRAKASTKKPS